MGYADYMDSQQTGSASPRSRAKVRGPRTRRLIEQVAHQLFLQKGFNQTSMLDIAEQAHVAPATVHYHFATKEEIVFGFYRASLDQFERSAQEICAESSQLEKRLRRLMATKLLELRPYRSFMKSLLRFSLDPDSPISPFSPKSREIRDRVVGVFARALDGCDYKFSAEQRLRVPVLLWLVQMGLIFVWLHDETEAERKTARVLEKSIGLLLPLFTVASLPIVGKLTTPLFELLDEYVPIQ